MVFRRGAPSAITRRLGGGVRSSGRWLRRRWMLVGASRFERCGRSTNWRCGRGSRKPQGVVGLQSPTNEVRSRRAARRSVKGSAKGGGRRCRKCSPWGARRRSGHPPHPSQAAFMTTARCSGAGVLDRNGPDAAGAVAALRRSVAPESRRLAGPLWRAKDAGTTTLPDDPPTDAIRSP